MTAEEGPRSKYLSSKTGDLTAYAAMIGEEFSSRIDRLAQILGTSHEQSVGGYKESLLRSVIARFIPKRYSVGHGFVAFTRESSLNDMTSTNIDLWNLKEHYVSRQLDIVVYDDYNFSPILQEDSFVVLRPESVRAVIEVKGYLKKANVEESIEGFVDFGRKWSEYRSYRKQRHEELHSPSLQLIAFDVYVPPSGEPDCDGASVRKSIVKAYRKILTTQELAGPTLPVLNAAYLYNDCIVNRCSYVHEAASGHGYSTSRGKFIRYASDRTPTLAGDATIASLLAQVHLSLETPFNPDFSYFDQSFAGNIFPHPCTGITDLHSGLEIDA